MMLEELNKDSDKYSSSPEKENVSIIKRLKNVFWYGVKKEDVIGYVIENRENGDVIVNYGKEGQKYIFAVDPRDKKLMFITDDLPHHNNIRRKYVPNWFCLWWWRVTINDEVKVIQLYWNSKVYGGVSREEKEVMVNLLKRTYPDYIISFK